MPLHLLLAITQGIEAAGALLDDKPFKAKGQGRKRFGLALSKLFPPRYEQVNRQLDLYSQLRSHMAHCMLPAASILLTDDASKHLAFSNGELQICLRSFFIDHETAILALLKLMEEGKLKEKNIAFQSLQGLDNGEN